MSPEALNLKWLLLVRRLVWVTQGLLILSGVVVLGIQLELLVLLGVVALACASNLGVRLWLKLGGVPTQGTILSVMLLDIALHTTAFALSGGPFNPFTQLYLVDLVLGTVILSRGRLWLVALTTAVAFAGLFALDAATPGGLRIPAHGDILRVHTQGMFVAFAVTAAFIVTFMQRVLASLSAREIELRTARAEVAKHEKLAALTTLAAGAAHELATPLGTIAVVARELTHALESRDVPQAWRDDAALMREQVQRCREILQRMSASSGELAAEGFARVGLQDWVTGALAGLDGADRVQRPTLDVAVIGPKVALTQVLTSLVRNALQAARTGVELRARAEDGDLLLEIADDGPGIAPEVLARIGEPFFTTRPPGQGMGLGVFLARTLATQLGGRLDYAAAPGGGTVARLTLPLAGGSS